MADRQTITCWSSFTLLALMGGCRPTPRPTALVASADQSRSGGITMNATACSIDSALPSRVAFIHEVLFSAPTERTPKFDDYTRGSYHVHKLDLARALPLEAARCGLNLKAVAILGPVGVLWSYYVVAAIEEDQGTRINSLVMPHARITGKSTAVISRGDAAVLLDAIERASLVQSGVPVVSPSQSPQDPEFAYRLLFVRYEPTGAQYFHADFDEFETSPGESELTEHLNALLSRTTTTYSHGARRSQSAPAPPR